MMLNMIPNIRTTAARFAALLVLAALLCAGVQAAMAAENEMTIAVGTAGGIDAIKNFGTDPTLAEAQFPDIGGRQDYQIYTHFSPLITLDGNSSIIPWMAESYEISDDYKTITFHLRKGIKFADGTQLNASILKFNFDRLILFGYKKNFETAKYSVAVYYDHSEALDDYTFKMHFNHSWQDMAFDLCHPRWYYFISPLDVDPVWDITGTLEPDRRYNGLGPYYVDENESVPKEKVVLKKRNSWRDDLNFHKPKLDKITLVKIADPQVATMALETGEIDYICRYWNAPIDALPNLEKNPKISIKTNPDYKMYFIMTSYWKEPFSGTDGTNLRKAICYAMNRTEIADGAFYGYALPATDSMSISAQRPDAPKCCNKGYDYDIEKAKQLLSEAGWMDTDGDGILDKNGKALKSLDLVIVSDLSWQKDTALMVKDQLKKVGIDIEIRIVEYGEWAEILEKGDYDLSLIYNQGKGFPISFAIKLFNLRTLTGSYNYYSSQDGTLETIVTNAQNSVNKEERDRYVCQACNILYDEAGIIPLVYEVQYAVMSSEVKGFEFGPTMIIYPLDHVEECWIKE